MYTRESVHACIWIIHIVYICLRIYGSITDCLVCKPFLWTLPIRRPIRRIYIYIYIAFLACFCHLYVGPIRGTSARQNGDFSFSYSLLLLPPPSLTPSPTPGPTPSSPTLIPIPISTPISPTPSPTSTPSLLWKLYGGPIRTECGGIPCDQGPPNAQVAIRRVYVARGSMGPWRCKMYNIAFVCACGAVCKMTYPATYPA